MNKVQEFLDNFETVDKHPLTYHVAVIRSSDDKGEKAFMRPFVYDKSIDLVRSMYMLVKDNELFKTFPKNYEVCSLVGLCLSDNTFSSNSNYVVSDEFECLFNFDDLIKYYDKSKEN